MPVLQSKFTKTNPQKIQTAERMPGTPVLDPPLVTETKLLCQNRKIVGLHSVKNI